MLSYGKGAKIILAGTTSKVRADSVNFDGETF
jgi:hypothetical protein